MLPTTQIISNLKVPLMLGDTIREARIRKGLTQARLAKLAGVSRRHLAALEKGANISINILRRVAEVLELEQVPLGTVAVRPGTDSGVNLPLLTETLREARLENERAQATIARAETLLGVDPPGAGLRQLGVAFPAMPVREFRPPTVTPDMLRDAPEWLELTTSGEIRHGEPVNEGVKETLYLPRSIYEPGEIVFRARGDNMRDQGIHDGDLLVVELRPRGRAATGELVIGKIGRNVYVGRWWQKNGMKALMSNGLSEVTVGRSTRSLKVVAAINQIIRVK